jgi:hypothetical protein
VNNNIQEETMALYETEVGIEESVSSDCDDVTTYILKVEQHYSFISRREYRKNDLWWAGGFKVSDNGVFVAYLVKRDHEEFNPSHDREYNKVIVHNRISGEERSTGLLKYLDSGATNFGKDYYSPTLHIENIVDIFDNGKVRYMTKDEVIHTL